MGGLPVADPRTCPIASLAPLEAAEAHAAVLVQVAHLAGPNESGSHGRGHLRASHEELAPDA